MSLTPEQRERAIRRIRRAIALSTDESTTEGERDAARHQAKKMMEEYCISHLEAEDITEDKQIVDIPYKPYDGLVITRDLFVVLPHILQPIAHYFGCFVVVNIHNGIRFESFCGYKPNIEMVQYTVDVVLRQGVNECKRLYRLNRSITFGQSFWSGFAIGIEKKFALSKPVTEKGLTLFDKVRQFVQEMTGGRTVNSAIDLSRPDYLRQGQHFGENVTVHSAINDPTNSGKFIK